MANDMEVNIYFLRPSTSIILSILFSVLDDTTASGYPAPYVANQIFWAIVDRKKEMVIAPFHHRLVIYIRTLFPWLYFFIMRLRARSSRILPDKRK